VNKNLDYENFLYPDNESFFNRVFGLKEAEII